MKKISKKVFIIHAVILTIIIAVGVAAYVRFWNVAIVNGTPISRISYFKTMEQQGGQQVLSALIEETLILNEGIKNNINVDQKTIDEEIAKIETQLKTQNETLDSALLASGMTRADLEKQIKIKKIETTLSVSKTEITQAQIDEFLKTNKSLLPTGKTKDELQTLAKDQLTLEANQTATTTWLEGLQQSAKIIYK